MQCTIYSACLLPFPMRHLFFRFSLPLISLFTVWPLAFSHANAAGIQFDAPPPPAPLYNSVTDPIKGSRRAPITLIEYTDFECPFCKLFQKTLKNILQKNGSHVSLVYRPYPLTASHKDALPAALAADCVFRQRGSSAFWKYSDALFAADTLSGANLTQLAQKQRVNVVKFNKCIANPDLGTVMEANIHNATLLGLQGAPTTFVVNRLTKKQQMVTGAVTEEELQKVIDELLKKKTTAK
ncbi:MAG: DSBA-like thioredoxin protein [Candidatus Peribacteria bacterium]|nr:DSBA-like thioredoxin protein [Candidatus Peribacteria bacterium]